MAKLNIDVTDDMQRDMEIIQAWIEKNGLGLRKCTKRQAIAYALACCAEYKALDIDGGDPGALYDGEVE